MKMALLKNKKSNDKETLLWIYKNCKRYFPAIAVITLFSVIVSLTFIVLALLSKDVIDVATGSKEGSLWFYGALLLVTIAVQIIVHICDMLLKTYTNGKLAILLRKKLFTSIARRKYSQITEYHSGDLLNRITSDTEVLISALVNVIASVVSMFAKIIGGLVALIALDKRLAFVILAFGFSVPALGRFMSRKYKYIHKEVQRTEGKSRSFMQECIENIVVLKAFEGEKPFVNKLSGYMKENFGLKMKRTKISIVTHMSLYTFFTLGYYAILLWGATQIAGGLITYGTLMAFLQLFQQIKAPLQNVSGIIPQYYSAIASAERLIEVEKGDMDKSSNSEILGEVLENFSGIELKDITFAYKDDIILDNLNLVVEKNKITAITGESGSGKSTIFKLLLGLYEAKSGSITVNGDIPLDTSLRGIFSYVPQGNMILSGTVRENLTICNESVTEEEIIKATKAAEIYDIIADLPDGFETELTERGGGLSEGQLQRISIARALLTSAPVLLLDEATSALDEATETKVLNNIKQIEGKTILFVTHRNTSLKVCDKILHIE